MSHANATQTNIKNTVTIDFNIACIGWPNEEDLFEITQDAITAVCAIANLNYPQEAVVSLLLSDDEEIRALNKRFRKINKATNVLSFPCQQIEVGSMANEILGDLAFALQTIEKESIEQQVSFDAHLSHLIIHGFLHLFGYDHINDDDAEKMETLEVAALASLGIENPYLDIRPHGELE